MLEMLYDRATLERMTLLRAEFPKTHAHQKGVHGSRVLTRRERAHRRAATTPIKTHVLTLSLLKGSLF